MVIDKQDYTYTVKTRERKRIINKITSALQGKKGIRFAFLHGSFAENRPFHDVDVAVYFDTNVSAEDRMAICMRLSTQLTADLQLPVDINELNGASPSFAYHASCGEILFCRDLEEVYEYKERVWITYMDFYPFLKQNLLDLLEV